MIQDKDTQHPVSGARRSWDSPAYDSESELLFIYLKTVCLFYIMFFSELHRRIFQQQKTFPILLISCRYGAQDFHY